MVQIVDRGIQVTQPDMAVASIEAHDVALGEERPGIRLIDGWIRRGRGLVAAIDPPLEGLEAAYRQHFLRADGIQAALCISFLIVPLVLLVSTDYLLFGSSVAFGLLLLMRLTLATFSALIVPRLRPAADPRTPDHLIAIRLVGDIGVMLIVNMTPQPTSIK